MQHTTSTQTHPTASPITASPIYATLTSVRKADKRRRDTMAYLAGDHVSAPMSAAGSSAGSPIFDHLATRRFD